MPGPRAYPTGRRVPRRLAQLYLGLVLYGASSALLVRAALGLGPWDVLHQGLSERVGLSIGTVAVVLGAAVLLLWVPLRQRPGLGTVSNVFLVGLVMDATLALVPEPRAMAVRVPLVFFAVALNGLATGLYVSARFGPGPRDGLMTGLHEVTGRSVRLVRTGIEIAVLATGFALGGSAGAGTVVYALAIGPLSQFFLRVCAVPEAPAADTPDAPDTREGGTAASRAVVDPTEPGRTGYGMPHGGYVTGGGGHGERPRGGTGFTDSPRGPVVYASGPPEEPRTQRHTDATPDDNPCQM